MKLAKLAVFCLAAFLVLSGATAQVIGTGGIPLAGPVFPGVVLSTASNNSQILGQAGPHTLMSLEIFNTSASLADVRFYDTAVAPTCSSATGVVGNYPVQALTSNQSAFVVFFGPNGKAFNNGVGLCITGANANNDNSNAPTGVNLNYGLR